MGLPLDRVEENTVEERLVRIEADVGHVRTDLSELGVDVREIRTDLGRFNTMLADLRVKLEKSIRSLQVWWFMTAAGIVGIMAHGFKWI